GAIALMTDNPRHELRRKQVLGFLNGPVVAALFQTARQMWMAKESVRSGILLCHPARIIRLWQRADAN
ncbi:MAG TPA: hypothetical protein VFU39_06505, partial [Sulfuricaulis sp.]|nr:hypothetical protein [Sulfuricaulis sp.]